MNRGPKKYKINGILLSLWKVGHLFQGHYRAILCDKDAYLLELVRYIHLNPVRAKLVMDLERYLWASHLNYLGEGGREAA